MKQNYISKLGLLLLCLLAVSFLDEITTKGLESLYYSNSESFEEKNSFSKDLQTPKKSNKVELSKKLIKTTKFVKANNNVYLRTINFYIRILKKLDDRRMPKTISNHILSKCKDLNIFEEMRESVMNCRVIQRKLDKKNKTVIRDFRVGCMSTILNLIRDKCSIVKSSKADKKFKTALDILKSIPKTKVSKLRVLAKRFLKRFAYVLKVFGKDVSKRVAEIKKIELKQEKAKKQKKNNKELEKKQIDKTKKNNANQPQNKINNNGESKKLDKNKKTLKESQIKTDLKIPKNTKSDDIFVKNIELTKNKNLVLANMVVKIIEKIINF